MTRALITGGRDYRDRNTVFRTLDRLLCPAPTDDMSTWLPPAGTVIIHGACPTGADLWADEWAVVNWTGLETYPAGWNAHGRAAGPLRNQRMLDEGRPDLVIAFSGGRGTADMVRRAVAAGFVLDPERSTDVVRVFAHASRP